MKLSTAEIRDLRAAKEILENPGLAAKVSNFVGTPIEQGLKKLPEAWSTAVNDVARKSIEKALEIALLTMDR
ncbi:MAG: EcsC family protein, partial [Deltaproteobacteria bacterium]